MPAKIKYVISLNVRSCEKIGIGIDGNGRHCGVVCRRLEFLCSLTVGNKLAFYRKDVQSAIKWIECKAQPGTFCAIKYRKKDKDKAFSFKYKLLTFSFVFLESSASHSVYIFTLELILIHICSTKQFWISLSCLISAESIIKYSKS